MPKNRGVKFVPVPISRPGADALLILEVYQEGDLMVCGLRHLFGDISLPPKAFIQAVREELQTIEQLARDAGCHEMRHAGRDWARFLLDYQPDPDLRNGLVKRL